MSRPPGLAGTRVLVTGGRGFLGSAVVRRLRADGMDVVAVGSSDHDLTQQADVRRMFAEVRADVVVHAAAAVGGIGANVANPGTFLYANAMMGLMVLEEARAAGVGKLVLISTTCSYPAVTSLPMAEADIWSGKPAGATGPYGMAKRLLHEACATYEQQFGFRSSVLVLANLYGPGDRVGNGHVIPMLIERFLDAERRGAPSVTNWGSGAATREFLHVDDAARAVALALTRESGAGAINIGTGVETSIREVSEHIQAAVGYGGAVLWDTSKPEGQARRVLDTRRATEILGWQAEIDLATGLAGTVAHQAVAGQGVAAAEANRSPRLR